MPYPHLPSPSSCPRCLRVRCHGWAACHDRGGHIVARRRLDGEVVVISGARRHANQAQVHKEIDELPSFTIVLTGLADGVDTWANQRAKARGLRTLGIPAEGRRWGRNAGHVRNEEMVVAADRMVALPWWGCRGTYDAIQRAKSRQMRCKIIEPRCDDLVIQTARVSPSAARTCPDFLDITAKTAGDAWTMRRGIWRRDIHPERLFAELADEAHKLIANGQTLASAAKLLRDAGAPSLGAVFAPTTLLLRPALEARKVATKLAGEGKVGEAIIVEANAWERYVYGHESVGGFVRQMEKSRRRYRAVWGLVAAQPSVTLACFCSKPSWWPADHPWPNHCHRHLVAAEFEKMGGRKVGEVGQETSAQLKLDTLPNPPTH